MSICSGMWMCEHRRGCDVGKLTILDDRMKINTRENEYY